jgi:proliferating cell nuclear antigen
MEKKLIDTPIVPQKEDKDLLSQAIFTIAAEAKVWKGILGTLGAVCDEVKLHINNNEITCAVVDPAHVMMVETKFERQMFSNWDIQKPGTLGIDVEDIMDAIAHTRDNEQIAITTVKNPQRKLNPGQAYFLDLQIDTADITRYRQLVDTHGLSEPKIPDLALTYSAKINYKQLQNTMNLLNKDHHKVDHITIRGDKEQIDLMMLEHTFRKEKAFLHSIKTFKGKDCVIAIAPPKEPLMFAEPDYRSIYPMDYMMHIFGKGKMTPYKLGSGKTPFFETVNIEFGSDYPIKITMQGTNMRLIYLMAPRIETE